ncbi:MAG: ABC transporter substrate-binding protein [Deltaproteobacteria bacterium]|nr:ABC transporter substrate-binding protein [Deltaproteobacteria bacterium]
MSFNRFVTRAAIACLLSVLTFSSNTEAQSSTTESEEVKIGAVLSLTGLGQTWGEQARRGIQLAENEINNTGGINGKKLTVIVEDSASQPARALSAFQKLTTQDGVNAVAGDILSFLTLPMVPAANQQKMLLVTPSIFDTDLPPQHDYFFTTCPTKESIRPSFVRFLDLNPKLKRIGIICAENSWGKTYLDVWQSVLKERKMEPVDVVCTQDMGTDFRAEVLRLKKSKPDAVIIPFGIDRAVRRLREQKMDVTILSTSDVSEAIYRRKFPFAEAEGIYFNDWPPGARFRDAFENLYGTHPIMEPQNMYEAVRSVAYALRLDAKNPKAAMSKLRYDGAGGVIDFTRSHAGNGALSKLMVVREFEIVEAQETPGE